MIYVVFVDEVYHNRDRFPRITPLSKQTAWNIVVWYSPDNKVIVLVIDQGWNASIGVVLGMLRSLVFAFAEIQIHGLVR
jgi:hypothetical protein